MIHSLIVVLKGTVANADDLVAEIKLLKGVATVKSGVESVDTYIATERAKYNLREKIAHLIE